MGEILAGINANVYVMVGIAIAVCLFLHKIIFSSKKKEALQFEAESDSGKLNKIFCLCK